MSFFNQPGIVSIVGALGLILTCVGLIALARSRRGKRISCYISSRVLIGVKHTELPSEVTISFEQRPVNTLTSTNVFIWNSGVTTIQKQDVVEADPLCIKFHDGEILLAEIVRNTREVNGFKATYGPENPSVVEFSFDFLDTRDGATMEILHTSTELYPEVTGTVRGLPKGISVIKPGSIPGHFIRFMNTIIMSFVLPVAGVLGSLMILASIVIPASVLRTIFEIEGEGSVLWNRIGAAIVGIVYALPTALTMLRRRRRYPHSLSVNH